jgi:glycosyltransferase involved in cell wall biosynthesis
MHAIPPWALITNDLAGWKTIRRRWESDLKGEPGCVMHLEDYALRWKRLTGRLGFRSSWHLASGRTASRTAYRKGCRLQLVSTLHYAAWLPRRKDVRYLICGDSTPDQLCQLYDGHPLAQPFRWLHRRIRALAADGHHFICFSNWYAKGLQEEYDVPATNITFLPPYVDTGLWQPQPRPPRRTPTSQRVVFLGADWARKGGDLVLAMARLPEFQEWEWHLVSPAAPQDLPPNCVAHRALRSETPELMKVMAESDLLVLPTRADCSSLASLEASAVGIPSIITNTGGIADLVKCGETGTLLKDSSATTLRAALEPYRLDPGLAVRQGQAARAMVETHFSRQCHLNTLQGALNRAAATMACPA